MKIEVKNIKHSRSLSEETNAFSADLYVEGIKIATCTNRGNGGSTDIFLNYTKEKDKEKYRELLKKAEAFAKTLPGVKSEFKKNGLLPMDLEFFVDLAVEKDLAQAHIKRFVKKLEKDCLNNIVMINKKQLDEFLEGGTIQPGYKMVGWKGRPINTIPADVIKQQLPAVKARLKEGEIIYNTNLPK